MADAPPPVMAFLLSPGRLQRQRDTFEKRRAARHEAPIVHYFHQLGDPYSTLLPIGIATVPGALPDHTANTHRQPAQRCGCPERAKLVAYSHLDAVRLAAH
jgi:hypothetical protein